MTPKTDRRGLLALAATAAAALALLDPLAPAHAAGPSFDFSPQQAGRVRAEKNTEAIAAIAKDFRFVKDGVFTVAIAPSAPPISTYATDTRTVVGSDADHAQLIAPALGWRL